jgi:MFS family permease
LETEAFLKKAHKPSGAEALRILSANWKVVILGVMLTVMTTVSFYLITAYTPTFGRQALKLGATDAMLVTLCVGLSNFFWLPIGGAVSDRIGRRPLLLICPATLLVVAYFVMSWLVEAPSFNRLLAVELLFSCLYGLYNGAMIPLMAEIMPPAVRTAGFSLAYALATAIFGGFTPAISTYLIEATGNRAAPALWLSAAAIIGLAAALLVKSRAAEAAKVTATGG